MLTIWKVVLKMIDAQVINVPAGAELLCAREQGADICVWFRCDPSAPVENRPIIIVGTGHHAPPSDWRYLHLLDNDFFGVPKPEWKARLAEIRDGGYRVAFNQGINVRVITDEIAAELATIEYRDDQFERRRLYTAWDQLGDEDVFFRGVGRLERAGIPGPGDRHARYFREHQA